MITVNETKLKNNLFEFLGQAVNGETISIRRNGKEIALLVPAKKKDWRDNIREKPKLLIPSDQAFSPMDEIWEDYH
ncbi:MAG: type II toxin-antitoxin system Phd/YefM family antitoxin [Candidatus Aminicenantes bacterium]|nr:type II toxin-antitoxin system Phd/YefM family antitoxin [Candidatus Aminicenantes bacterium]